MNVYIPGMEMPTSCWDCYFQDCGNCRLNAHKVVDKCITEDRIDDDCPLVPVPEHGRLIDAESLAEMHFTDCMYDADSKLFVPFVEIASAIFDAPTIIPASGGNYEGEEK